MKKSFIKFVMFLVFVGTSVEISADNENAIPIDKLVCYGQGTSQSLSPSGEFYAAMVPIDKNVCDIEDESDQEASRTKRVNNNKIILKIIHMFFIWKNRAKNLIIFKNMRIFFISK